MKLLVFLVTMLALSACSNIPEKLPVSVTSKKYVVVDKSDRKLYLLNNDKVIKAYKVHLGKNAFGRKYKRGDKRTPEGNYFLTKKSLKSSYYRSIHITYPNRSDKIISKSMGVNPGSAIVLHGFPNYTSSSDIVKKRGYDWTDGCIALDDKDLDEVWKFVDKKMKISIVP